MSSYKIDVAHSDILFKVKHLMINTVTGQFNNFDSGLETESEDFSDAKIWFNADVNSINTRNEQRDGHLKSDDFFNAEKYPQVVFSNGHLIKNGDAYTLKGDITIRDITQPVELKVDYMGAMVDPWGQSKIGFEAEGILKRKSFGLSWDAVTEAGGIVVSDDVKLQLNVQFVKAQ
jgi:polyisoprenoid-binding protein YceI